MSATLLFLVPIGLLAVAWLLCFVGCALQTAGIPFPYSNIVLGEASLIAYWPLNDASGSGTLITSGSLQNSVSFGTAADLTANFGNPDPHPGTYIAPPAYPNPPIASSAAIPGAPTVGPASSIVPGDVGNSTFQDKLANPGSAAFGGGYVGIPWGTMPKSPQLGEFTFEAWIMPNWSGTGVAHVLFGALATNNTGFVIAVDENNHLQLVVGNGTTTASFSSSTVVIEIVPGIISYVAVSFNVTTQMFSLFASQLDGPPMKDTIANTGYVATDPTDPALQTTFFIGAGRNAQAPRTTAGDVNGAPEFPFQGQMQSVALYGSASIDVQSHFTSGATTPQ